MKASRLDFENEILTNTMAKSYIFQMAEKSKTKSKHKKSKIQESQSLKKPSSRDTRFGIMKSTSKNRNNANLFKALITNISKTSSPTCCTSQSKKVPVIVSLQQPNQMQILSSNTKKVLYFINFNTVEVKLNDSLYDQNHFILEVSDDYLFRFEEYLNTENGEQKGNRSPNEFGTFKQLRNTLKIVIAQSSGVLYKMSNVKSFPLFPQKSFKSAIQFAEMAQNGDIILFQGTHFWAKMQRFFTGSDYDHVGLLYRDPIHGLLIFQSNSSSGICLTPWEYVLKYKWYKFIEKIVWRRLEGVERDNQFYTKYQDLIIQKLGRNYHISVQKLLTNNSYIHRPSAQKSSQPTNSSAPQQHPGYFCSQLVAATYKDLHLLTRDTKSPHFKPSCNYYPYHFSERFQNYFLEGKLGREITIVFEQGELREWYGEEE